MRRFTTKVVTSALVLTVSATWLGPVPASAGPVPGIAPAMVGPVPGTAPAVVGTALAAGAARLAPAAVAPPDTPAGRQLEWLLDVSRRLPVSAAEAAAHLSAGFLAAVPLAEFNAGFAEITGPDGLVLLRWRGDRPDAVEFLVEGDRGVFVGGVTVDAAGLVAGLSVTPFAAAPASWSELDRRLRALAPRVSLLVARLPARSPRCRPVHGIHADRARPLGSGFKLYVLGALAREVAAGRAAWDERLAVRDEWKSLPSGVLQDEPAGTELPLRQYANLMISISDNTATDHLIHRLGRATVARQQERFGLRRPARNAPWLTTREVFTLKLTAYPHLARAYAALPPAGRRFLLGAVVDRLPLPTAEQAEGWTDPRAIDSIEWFASPADICRAFAGLRRQAATPGLSPVATALSLSDGGLWLDPVDWRTTWFKGGSEPGVLTLSYLARSRTGATFVVSAMLSDPRAPIADTAAVELQALVRGGFALAAG
jgi:hypothetical protein